MVIGTPTKTSHGHSAKLRIYSNYTGSLNAAIANPVFNQPTASMSLPNYLTLSRVPMMFLITALLLADAWQPLPSARWAAFACFALAASTDWLDGYLARKLGQISNFGKLMDALTDKILMVGLFVTLLAIQVLPLEAVFGVVILIGREFFITGLRMVAASTGEVLAAEASGKYKTIFQMAAAILILLAHALGNTPPAESIHQAGLAGFWISVLLTIYSGTHYTCKYRHLLNG